MKVITLDTETTTQNKGNPFDPRNKMCSVGVRTDSAYYDYSIEYDSRPYGESIRRICEDIEQSNLLVGFNLKFDLHWIRKYAPDIKFPTLWDCQLGEYLLSNQTITFPSLEECSVRNGLGNKLDVVRMEYWERGLDTTDVPYPILAEYLEQDVNLTHALYKIQEAAFEADPGLSKLFKLGNEDIRWLAEAEWNGMAYDIQESLRISEELGNELSKINSDLVAMYECPHINWNSDDHISIVLFGGTLYYTGKETYVKELKAGPVERERNAWLPIEFKGQLKPDPRSQNLPLSKVKDDELELMNKERIELRKKPLVRTYSVAENILRGYKPKGRAKKTIELLLRKAELDKLISTYYDGIPKIMETYQWGDILHGTFNKVGTRTGRLSSSKPNAQNFASSIKPLFRSRYAAS